jgi:hypothetical protein
MAEMESAHGKLSPVDQKWNAPKFLVLFVVALFAGLSFIYLISSIKSGDYGWSPFAHDIVKHTIESSSF